MNNLSVVVIGKDNEKTISSVIENGLQLGSEVIYVDTGSKDNTIRLAESSGAKVIDFPMKEFDYSTPRGIGDDNASNDWVLHLDTDEKIDVSFKTAIERIVKEPKYDGYYFYQRQFLDEKFDNAEAYLCRLYNRGKMRHKGFVWETLHPIKRLGTANVIVNNYNKISSWDYKFPFRLGLEKREIINLEKDKVMENKQDILDLICRSGSMQLILGCDIQPMKNNLLSKLLDYSKYAKQFSDDPLVPFHLSRAYSSFKNKELSLEVLRDSKSEEIDYYLFWYTLGQKSLQIGDVSCLDYLKKSVELEENSGNLALYALALEQFGEKSNAKKLLRRALEIIPQDTVLQEIYRYA